MPRPGENRVPLTALPPSPHHHRYLRSCSGDNQDRRWAGANAEEVRECIRKGALFEEGGRGRSQNLWDEFRGGNVFFLFVQSGGECLWGFVAFVNLRLGYCARILREW
jgi:hypothetical protein